MHHRFALPVLAALLLACLPTQAAWRHTTHGGIEVYTEISVSDTRELLDDLHRFREALRLMFPKIQDTLDLDLEGRPIRLILLEDDDTHHSVLPLYREKPRPASGLFSPGPAYDMIWVDADRSLEYVRQTLFHEFTHILLRNEFSIPLAFEEGLAELLSGMLFDDGRVTLGTPEQERLLSLSVQRQIPPHELLLVGHGSHDYNHIGAAGPFYDQAWLMMDYMLCGNPPEPLSEGFWTYIGAARLGVDTERLSKIAASGLAGLGPAIKDYYNAGNFKLLGVEMDDLPPPPQFDFRRVSKAEIQSVLAGAQAMAGRVDEARETFTRLQDKYKRDPGPFREAAFIELRYNNRDSAQTAASQAIANGASHPILDAIMEQFPEPQQE